MAPRPRLRPAHRDRPVSGGVGVRARPAGGEPARADADARVITLRGGVRWLVTVVARLLSEDVATGRESARLVLRFECLTQPSRPVRVATVRARTLQAVSEGALGSMLGRAGGAAGRGAGGMGGAGRLGG